MHARLPYRDDSFDGDDVVALANAAAVAAAQARVDQADEAYRQALYWNQTAKPSNRDIRRRHLEACTRAGLEAAAALRAAKAGA